MILDGIFDLWNNYRSKRKAKKEAKKYRTAKTDEVKDPKTQATENNEPWVTVLKTHVDPTSPRNGFFELDWNEQFVSMLRGNGYTGVTEEEIVDQWFSDLCREVGSEENVPGLDRRGSGYINVNKLSNGRSEVS